MIFYSITLHRIKKEKYMLNVTNDIIHIIKEKLKKNKKGEFKEIKDLKKKIKIRNNKKMEKLRIKIFILSKSFKELIKQYVIIIIKLNQNVFSFPLFNFLLFMQ